MSDQSVFRTMVVAAAIAPMARDLALAIPGGSRMFVAGYSPTGAAPATHFVNEGWILQVFADAMSDPEILVPVLAQYGQVMSLAQATALLSQAIVSDRPAAEVLAELGVVPVAGTAP